VKTILSDNLLQEMIRQARRASQRAYCPYSRFRVGAAALTSEGKIFAGCNVENASYGLTICAERNAVFQAVSQSLTPPMIRMVVVYTPTPEPTAPCGACRQVINEFGPDAEVYCVGDGKDTLHVSIRELLKHAFGPQNLI
jgi:cytidine deaminase